MKNVNKERLNEVLRMVQEYKYLSEEDELFSEDFDAETFLKELSEKVEEILSSESEDKKTKYLVEVFNGTFGFIDSKEFDDKDEAFRYECENDYEDDEGEVVDNRHAITFRLFK